MNKLELYNKCSEEITKKINRIKDSLNEVQQAANNETKSSAGDKHETGRAMAQLETEKLTNQLSELINLQNILTKINPNETHRAIGLGSLVQTNKGLFYISIPLGKISLGKVDCYAISTTSPIAKIMFSKGTGDSFSFNRVNYEIEMII